MFRVYGLPEISFMQRNSHLLRCRAEALPTIGGAAQAVRTDQAAHLKKSGIVVMLFVLAFIVTVIVATCIMVCMMNTPQ